MYQIKEQGNPAVKTSILKMPILPFLQMIMVLYLMVWSISPPLDIDMIYRIIALGCAIIWFILDLPRNLHYERIHLYAFLFILMVVMINIIQHQGFSQIMKSMTYYMLFMAFLMNYSYQNRWNELHLLLPIILGLFIVFNIITFRELAIDPTLARKIVRADESIYPFIRRGVGGFALEHVQVFLFPLFLAWISKALKHHKFYFILGVVWIISYVLLILHSGYSIAIVTTISSLVVLLFYKRARVWPALLITLVIIVLIVLLIGYVDAFRESLLSFFDGTKVARKIEDIYNSIHGTEVADSIQSRIDRYLSSIQTIFCFPFIGGLWFAAGGGHSILMDTFAQYGIWGGVIFVKMFYCVPMKVKKESSDIRDVRIANAFLVSLLVVTLLDGMPYNMVYPVLIIAPILFEDIKKWRSEAENALLVSKNNET